MGKQHKEKATVSVQGWPALPGGVKNQGASARESTAKPQEVKAEAHRPSHADEVSLGHVIGAVGKLLSSGSYEEM